MRKLNKISKTTKAATSEAQAVQTIATDAPASEAQAPATPIVTKHDIKANYAGASQPFTSRKSRTPITAVFNSLAGHPTSDRDNAFITALKNTYAAAEFPRLNADAGNLRRAIERGFINYGSQPNTFVLTESALTTRLA